MLLKTIAEVKSVLRISNLDDASNLPDIASAEETYIIPAIGQTLYESLNSAYNDEPPTLAPIEQDLLLKIQKPLAAHAYLDDLGLIHAQIGDAGVRRTTTDNMPAAYRWEVDEVKNALANRAFQGMESLLKYLEKYKAQFPDWTASEAFKRRTRYLIKSGYDFSDQFTLYHPLRTYNALLAIMGDVEELYIIPSIGKTFFDELKSAINPDANQVQVIADLKKAIAHLCIMHACEKLPVRISDAGFTINTAIGSSDSGNANREHAPNANLSVLITSCQRDGKSYLMKAKAFLNEKATALIFTTYFNSEYYKAPQDPDTPIEDGNSRRKIFTL
jgi:hypothetical protein